MIKKKPHIKEIIQFKIPNLQDYINKSGLKITSKKLSKVMFLVSIFLSIFLLVFIFIKFPFLIELNTFYLVLFVLLWIVMIFVFFGVNWFIFLIFLDLKIKKSGKKPEKKKKIKKTHTIHQFKKEKKKKQKISYYRRRKRLLEYIKKSGIELSIDKINKIIFRTSIILFLFLTGYLFYKFIEIKPGLQYIIIITLILWTLGFILLLLLLWSFFYLVVDLMIYNRTKKIEEVLPDFLHLTSANISAGMPIDRALWFAVRPRFGILASEIEEVAKATMVGERLDEALKKFTNKYDSDILKRSINLLLEGMECGGEIGDLLNRIANNIEETRIIKKEMAANVTTYVIFIIFATVVAAPFLFGLSTELIVIMQTILSNIDMGSLESGGSGGLMFEMSADTLNLTHYKTFVITCICITAFFSTVIITIIKKGNVKEGLHLIPVFAFISLVIYFVSVSFMHFILGGFFS
jgi:pilus assembly protein TadC